MSWWMLALGGVGWLLALNALRPPKWPSAVGLIAFFVGWVTADLPIFTLMFQGVVALYLIGAGAMNEPIGVLGLGLLVTSWAGLFRAHQVAHSSAARMDAVLDGAGIAEASETWMARRLLLPFPVPQAGGHYRVQGLPIRKVGMWTQKVDVFAPKQPGKGRPVLVFSHGGGWVMSFRFFQGVPLMQRLAERGWVCIRVTYRLFPLGAYPDNLTDVKHGIAWARQNAHRWGGDPDRFLALHGNSAGGHLAALAALTPHRTELQPGFEEVDTSVDACALAYPPTDLTNRYGEWGPDFRLFVRLALVQRPFGHDWWTEASPIEQVHADAPPILVVHGEQDSLVPVGEGRRLVDALTAVGASALFTPIPGGQHALDVFLSRKGLVAVDGMVRWLAHQRHVADRSRQQSIPEECAASQ